MGYLTVKNWDQFQHYKDRNPPWIKLHRTLLDDYEFSCLQDASKLHLMLIWLLASQSDGRIPDDAKFLQGKLGLKSQPNLQPLISNGFLIVDQSASKKLAPDASKLHLETEAYKASEAEVETRDEPTVKTLIEIGVADQAAKDWLKVRKAKRAPLTWTVIESLKLEAAKAGITVPEAVAICARKNWQGFDSSWSWKGES